MGAGTWAKYDSHLRDRILLWFGDVAMGEVERMAVKSLRWSLAEPTVIDVVLLLSMVLGEAVEEGLIGANPCRRLRLRLDGRGERPHARPEQVTEVARGMRPADGVLIITVAYAGMRWGELVGLQWARVDLDAGEMVINPRDGVLHEVNGHWRSNFRRRVWLPAVGGDPARGWAPIAPGLHVHDLRHTHKTWLIGDQVPEVLRSR